MEQTTSLGWHSGHLLIAGLWVAYFSFHSLLASRHVKAYLLRAMPFLAGRYRLIYNLIALFTIIPVLLAGAVIQGPRLLPPNDFLRYLAMFFATWGVIVVRLAFKVFDFRQFIGFSPYTEDDEKELKKEGILSKIRHPIYAGALLIVIGYALFAPTITNWIICFISVVYIFIGIRIEEKRLMDRFGIEYKEYKEKVPALIPRLGR
ncbi:isoprenylcysteine carboxylmethyltransferase family protein [Roseivirga sp. BDSF3-8]|uniref:methyltransferase family protein n=1 Tax=Roseivirga sp. BDSF3-8 TaxID=3241598 RepID=UPI003531F67D